ncbi:MAG: alpha/beta hydrolase fold domain-containing protein [Sedimentisphaerales bacterium]|nr:alpha/beta hydrolase fold domain-containing protein [Sedimentisphaerales bacterium]
MTVNRSRRNLRVMVMVMSLLTQGVVGLADTMPAGLHTDIVYGQADGESLRLDAFVPEGEKLQPVIIMVHGGGWVGGDKNDMSLLYEPLSQAGFTWFSINYRLAPQHRWPACLDDVQSAVRWIKAHASDYKGDSKRIALLGYSAGGHLVCMTAIREPVQAVVGIAPPTDHLADSVRRGGLSECMQKLLHRPRAIDKEARDLLQKISPINDITSNLPPFLLVHGTTDQSVLYSQSINFREKLSENDVPCELITIEGAPHRISEWTKYEPGYQAKIVDWLSKTIGDDRPIVFTVNADGSGDYTTVQAAVDAVPENNTKPTIIVIKPGTYKEKIVIPRTRRFITFKGDSAETTILTNNLYARMKDENGEELGTFRTPSVTIDADDFSAENITFENSAGDVGQAVAASVRGDRIVFRTCRFLGWQDTLLDQSGRHYYENCYIAGHCDFIFGGGTAFFENCHIHCLSASYITAASTPQHQPFGYVFYHCKITGEPEGAKTYLGRPWRDYASVVFLNTTMSDVIRPEGWHNWNKAHREKTAFYAEYNSTGPGADPQARVDWSRQLTAEEAKKFTLEKILSGDDAWNPMSSKVKPN